MAVPTRPVSGQPIASAWGQVAHDAIVAQDLQAGVATVTAPGGTAAPTVTLVFPRAFGGVPTVVCVAYTGSGTLTAFSQGPSATQVVLGVANATGAGSVAAGPVSVAWFAFGPRA